MSPVGRLLLISDEKHLLAIEFDGSGEFLRKQIGVDTFVDFSTDVIDQAVTELDEYFQGTRKSFSVPYRLVGSDFQKRVWGCLETIPYGEVWSYQTQSEKLGDPKAIRAVASANGRNPMSIIVPCHRVIGKTGTLTGFGGGVDVKAQLLGIEGYSIRPRKNLSSFVDRNSVVSVQL